MTTNEVAAAEAATPAAFRGAAHRWFSRYREPSRPASSAAGASQVAQPQLATQVIREHLRGVIEAIVFAADKPMSHREIAKAAKADLKVVKELLAELSAFYKNRGFRLDEVAGGWAFRTSPAFSPFVRDMTAKKPVRMSRAQIETLAIVAYRQPITRPEIDDVRGVDSGAVLKALLDRELVRILGKRDEPGRPIIYGTTPDFLEFFGLKALADLPTLREFTELTDESRMTYERELGEEAPAGGVDPGGFAGGEGGFAERVAEPASFEDVAPDATPPANDEDGVHSVVTPKAEPTADDDEEADEDDEDDDADDDEDADDDDADEDADDEDADDNDDDDDDEEDDEEDDDDDDDEEDDDEDDEDDDDDEDEDDDDEDD